MNRTYIKDIIPGTPCRVRGFVENIRNKRTMAFLVIRDVTGKLQLTVEKEKMPEIAAVVDTLMLESVITVTGTVVENEYVKLGGREMLPETTSLSISNCGSQALSAIWSKPVSSINFSLISSFHLA